MGDPRVKINIKIKTKTHNFEIDGETNGNVNYVTKKIEELETGKKYIYINSEKKDFLTYISEIICEIEKKGKTCESINIICRGENNTYRRNYGWGINMDKLFNCMSDIYGIFWIGMSE